MRGAGFLLVLLSIVSGTVAQNSSLSAAIATLPPCAVQCLKTSLADSSCQPTDQACICTDTKLLGSVEACVLQACTIKQGLATKNTTMTTCGAPIRNRGPLFKRINITFGVLSSFFVMSRLAYKSFVTISELGLDDYFILATLIAGVPQTIISDRGLLPNGIGRDIWTLKVSQITDFLMYFYIMEVMYFAIVAILKMSLLFFYRRIFPGVAVRKVILATIIFNALYGITFVIAALSQCQPLSYYWTNWDGEHEGTCININALGWANAAVSIALDIWMLAIPLSQLIHLKLAWRKKIGVAAMFCVGFFVTIVSALRLQSLIHFGKSMNPTWDQWDVINWSTIEINVGIMCACMPAMRVILVRFFPKVFGTTDNRSNQYYAKYGSRSGAPGKGTAPSNGGLSSALGRDKNGRDKHTITFTKTFEVSHADKDGDEIGLVSLDGDSGKAKPKSGSSSSVSL
ncbi:hypothetical protein BU24DRAFT_419482 [Aaosphaeria arxii CBS 175.79]|uniref:CFEM domain-containing protein n=1 Tax=Aaosphaeria arxii CBS 175.79 TaxID=1450172 RepID=A0A6A5Y2W4_9PLEO|nr:uncharacterized protein BU24DRAFT_419482 [Aaosphaeria arxii CBS 175.79]KAF2019882.1 hypothetical protein BU24DRAFT_419482 [Aaosphaeria arxii CBS 175.79]